jgi:hypothetical protein
MFILENVSEALILASDRLNRHLPGGVSPSGWSPTRTVDQPSEVLADGGELQDQLGERQWIQGGLDVVASRKGGQRIALPREITQKQPSDFHGRLLSHLQKTSQFSSDN